MPSNHKNASGPEDLSPSVKGKERTALLRLAESLSEKRPLPSPGFRSSVRGKLLSGADRRPPQLRALIFGYGLAGTLLLVVAALGLTGLGPLAAG